MEYKVKLRFKNGEEKRYETNSIVDAKGFIKSYVGSSYTIYDSDMVVVESGKVLASGHVSVRLNSEGLRWW